MLGTVNSRQGGIRLEGAAQTRGLQVGGGPGGGPGGWGVLLKKEAGGEKKEVGGRGSGMKGEGGGVGFRGRGRREGGEEREGGRGRRGISGGKQEVCVCRGGA